MRRARRRFDHVAGLSFYRLLGSGGGNGFSAVPDFSTYVLLTVWQAPEREPHFRRHEPAFRALLDRAAHHWTVYLRPLRAKGAWGGRQPFAVEGATHDAGPVAVLTRATLHWHKLPDFWRHVPRAASRLFDKNQRGLLFSKGVGEEPLWQQATFTLWDSRRAMVDYAYQGTHREVMMQARQRQWYREELFAEFVPVATAGHWPGMPPLPLPEVTPPRQTPGEAAA